MRKKAKNKQPILTVLVPVYNTEKYIKKCLLSLADNKFNGKLEVIVVSDGSKDNSIKIAGEISKKYPDIFSIVEKENGGHGSTINVGIKKANGKYFRVLDSDDWFDKKEFVKFLSKLEKSDSDLIISNYSKEYVNDGISEKIEYNKLADSTEYEFDSFDLKMLDGQFFAMATMTYKTSILQKMNFQLPEKTFYVDMIYDVVPLLNVKSFTYFDCNIYKYYIGRIGQSVNLNSYAKNHLNHDKVTHQLIDFYEKNKADFSENKKNYIKNIIHTVINTNYAIYTIFFTKKKDGYNRAKSFDLYLKNISQELYSDTNKALIKMYRKTKFVLALIIPNKIRVSIYKMIITKRK